MRQSPTDLIDTLRVAAPCSVPWEGMDGDGRTRFCDACKLHVHNVSGLTRDEAEELIREAEGRICVRMLRRPDGTVITQDCPRGLAALRRRARQAWHRTAAACAVLWMGASGCDASPSQPTPAAPSPPTTLGPRGCGTSTAGSPGLLTRAYRAVRELFVEPQHEIVGEFVLPPHEASPENAPGDPPAGR